MLYNTRINVEITNNSFIIAERVRENKLIGRIDPASTCREVLNTAFYRKILEWNRKKLPKYGGDLFLVYKVFQNNHTKASVRNFVHNIPLIEELMKLSSTKEIDFIIDESNGIVAVELTDIWGENPVFFSIFSLIIRDLVYNRMHLNVKKSISNYFKLKFTLLNKNNGNYLTTMKNMKIGMSKIPFNVLEFILLKETLFKNNRVLMSHNDEEVFNLFSKDKPAVFLMEDVEKLTNVKVSILFDRNNIGVNSLTGSASMLGSFIYNFNRVIDCYHFKDNPKPNYYLNVHAYNAFSVNWVFKYAAYKLGLIDNTGKIL